MIPADNPIDTKDEDRLGRAKVAETLAHEIRELDASSGCVVGILGPWGSGKTSLVNLIRGELTEKSPQIVALDFNPWMFSGADELLQAFFLEVGAQFRTRADRLADLADDIEAYGEVVAPLRLLPVIGVWVERARTVVRAVRKAIERRRGGALASRDQLARKLAELPEPIVIVVDDIDRLRTHEIREIFKLVRLTASFPNVIYLLAFDRHRVETALSEEGLVGRDYLEKILQVAYDLPVVPDEILTRTLTEALDASLKDIEDPGPFDVQAWPDILFEVIRPLVRNMRDVRRYVASVHGTLIGLGGRVAMADVLGLEAIRVFLPDAFKALQAAEDALTKTSPAIGLQDSPRLKASIEELLGAEGDRGEVVRALITRLFPAARRHVENMHYGSEFQNEWLKERRVAHPEILKFYLERVVGEKLQAFDLAEKAFEILGDEEALTTLLSSLDGDRLADVLGALEAYEHDFPESSVEPACAVILNQMGRVSERPGPSLLTLRPDIIVARVVLRLLRRISNPAEVDAVVRRLLPRIETLSSRSELLKIVGHRENAGHKLISKEAAAEHEAELRSQIRAADASMLAQEHDLLRLFIDTRRDAEPSEPPLEIPRVPELDAQLLKASVTETRSQSLESRSVTTSKLLHWDVLVEVMGGESAIQEMVDRIGAVSDDTELEEALGLARRYLTGWRPKRFDE